MFSTLESRTSGGLDQRHPGNADADGAPLAYSVLLNSGASLLGCVFSLTVY